MQKSLEFVWGDGEGVEKSYKKAKAVLVKDISNINISLDKLPDIESVIKLEQFVREREKKKEFVEENTVCTSLINCNSPMVMDEIMLGALKAYSRANQAVIITPFIMQGAMTPVTIAGTLSQALAEAMAGMTVTQLVKPGAPVVFGTFSSSMSMQSGAPTFGTPEPQLVLYIVAALSRRLGVPFRSGGGLNAAKITDAQAAYE